MMNPQEDPNLVANTYHSRIEKVNINGTIAVKKTAQRRTGRTIVQWQKEVKAMQLVAKQAGSFTKTMCLLLDQNFDDLSLTMRSEPGHSLDQHVSQTMMCTVDAQDVDLVWLNIGSAIGFLHSRLVIHDDVKPENIIWIPEQHRAVLIDFGAAIVTESGEKIQFNPSGTPPYAPPEFLDRRKGFEGDIWALGVTILFARQCIRLPEGEWILPHCFEQEEPLRQMRAWLSEIEQWRVRMADTDEVLAKMLEADPDQRMTGEEMMQMLEARLEQASILKKVVDAIKDLVQDCNFDCNDSGIALQAMDNSHVALVSMMLKSDTFSPFRCDRNIALGINLNSFQKVLRCAQNEDILTLKADDSPDVVSLVFESSEQDRISEYDIKLMDIDQEHLGIPDTEYAATITMPSGEFQRICRDLSALSESVAIEAEKNAVKFVCNGDIGNGAISLRNHSSVEKPEQNVNIELSEPVALTFSLKYLVNFCKASGLSGSVKLCLSNEVPLLVEYELASNSYLRFYLAPKIGDDE